MCWWFRLNEQGGSLRDDEGGADERVVVPIVDCRGRVLHVVRNRTVVGEGPVGAMLGPVGQSGRLQKSLYAQTPKGGAEMMPDESTMFPNPRQDPEVAAALFLAGSIVGSESSGGESAVRETGHGAAKARLLTNFTHVFDCSATMKWSSLGVVHAGPKPRKGHTMTSLGRDLFGHGSHFIVIGGRVHEQKHGNEWRTVNSVHLLQQPAPGAWAWTRPIISPAVDTPTSRAAKIRDMRPVPSVINRGVSTRNLDIDATDASKPHDRIMMRGKRKRVDLPCLKLHTACYCGFPVQKLFVFGGEDGSGMITDALYVLHMESNGPWWWEKAQPMTKTTNTRQPPRWPGARAGHAAAVYGRHLYVVGGRGGGGVLLQDVWRVDLGDHADEKTGEQSFQSLRWELCVTRPRGLSDDEGNSRELSLLEFTARTGHTCAASEAKRRLYVFGGSALRPSTASWNPLVADSDTGVHDAAPTLEKSDLSSPGADDRAAAHSGDASETTGAALLFAAEKTGGAVAETPSQLCNQLFEFDPRRSRFAWRNLSATASGVPPTPRHGHSTCIIKGREQGSRQWKDPNAPRLADRLFVFGGEGILSPSGAADRGNTALRPMALNDLYVFDLESEVWSRPAVAFDGRGPTQRVFLEISPRSGLAMSSCRGKQALVLFGGATSQADDADEVYYLDAVPVTNAHIYGLDSCFPLQA